MEDLRFIERFLHDSEIPVEEQIAFEVAHYGTMLSTFPDLKGQYAVIEVDEKYSPKLKLYNLANGNTGVMKMRKASYAKAPIHAGDRIKLMDWSRQPAYLYSDGKPVKREGIYELWLTNYEKMS